MRGWILIQFPYKYLCNDLNILRVYQLLPLTLTNSTSTINRARVRDIISHFIQSGIFTLQVVNTNLFRLCLLAVVFVNYTQCNNSLTKWWHFNFLYEHVVLTSAFAHSVGDLCSEQSWLSSKVMFSFFYNNNNLSSGYNSRLSCCCQK